MGDKKKRGSNFSSTEINLFMKHLLTQIHVIENKKTDGVSLKEKANAWQKVFNNFISENIEKSRDISSLKLKYDNIKRNIRKKNSVDKKEIMKTGGGPGNDIKLLWYEEQLYGILQLSIEGLQSEGDCDSVAQNKAEDTTTSTVSAFSTLPNAEGIQNFNDYSEISGDSMTKNNNLVLMENERLIRDPVDTMTYIEEEMERGTDIQKIAPRQGSSTTCDNRGTAYGQGSSTPATGWNLRKRKKTAGADDKRNTLYSFEKLSQKKSDLTITQQKCCEIELGIKMEQDTNFKEKWRIEKQILETELKIKEENLEAIKEERRRQEIFHILNEEEKKIKIEILKYELNQKLQRLRNEKP